MDKDLPNIYKGEVNIDNNQEKSILNEEVIVNKEIDNIDIKKDIKDIFTSKDFLYKAEVFITLKNNEKIKKTIIGTNNNSLITIDDELIDINNISQIELI